MIAAASPTSQMTMHRFGPVLAILVVLVCFHRSADAQLTESDQTRLASEIESAVDGLDEERFPDLQQSQQSVLEQIDETRAYFQRSTDSDNAAAWMKYLDVEPLVDAIETNQSPAAVGRAAQDLRFRLLGTAPGLDLKALVNLRTSVENLINALLFRDKERGMQQIAAQLQALATLVREIDGNPTPEQATTLSARTRVIAASGQAAEVIASLRQAFDEPNVAVRVSESLVQQAVEQEVEESSPVRDCILGTRLVGDALLTGVVTAELIPSSEDARIKVKLVGEVASQNIGYNGPIRLRTTGDGTVTTSRLVTLNQSGVELGPTSVDAATLSTKITRIEHRLKIVRNIARQQAAKKKRQADRIALGRMRDQIREQFSEQTNEVIDTDSPEIDKAEGILKRLSLEKPVMHWSSNENALRLRAIFRRNDQLASIMPRPEIGEEHDLVIQVHESALDNAFGPILAGRTLGEDELNRLLEDVDRSEDSAEESGNDDEKPFRIDFARVRPIIFEARDGMLRLGVRGTRFSQDGRELKRSMEITAIYAPTESDGQVSLTRQGDVKVNFPGSKRLTVSQAGLRRTIQKKFSEVFPTAVLDEPLEIPDDAELESLRGRVFLPRQIEAADGWLTVGIR